MQDLCQKLVAHAKQFPTNYEVFVLDSATVNAMTTPGFIFVYRGILNAAKTEDELAGVLAHHVAKAQTRQAIDQQQVAELKQSNSKFSQFLAKMLEAGNPLGQLTFSRENEAQADRLAVHIAYDAGFNPEGLVGMFRTFESMSPSSRSSWDLMTRTHPFSIDRVHNVTEYSALLPARPAKPAAPAFARMKARVAALPPPDDAVGLMKPAVKPPAKPTATAGGPRSFSIDDTPLTGDIPADWGARKTESGTIVFEGAKGTEAYEVSVELQVIPKTEGRVATILDVAREIYGNLMQRPNAKVQQPRIEETTRGQTTAIVSGTYALPVQARAVPFSHMTVVIDYAEHMAVVSYYGPDALYTKYAPAFELIGDSLRYRGR